LNAGQHPRTRLAAIGLLLGASAGVAAQPSSASVAPELLAALSSVRARGCGGHAGAATRLRPAAPLYEAARRVAQGASPTQATKAAGYRAKSLFQVHLNGYRSAAAVADTLASRYCEPLTNARLVDVGFHREGTSYWVLMAEPFTPPAPSEAAEVSARVLALTNQARSQPRRCGERSFDAAAPVKPNALLERAAAAHAQDMARHGVLQHEGSDGSDASQRLTRVGYRWRSMGENVASGQTTPEQVVAEWLRSPGHCATLMNPTYTEMGVAYAVNMTSESGIYWAQEFARPR
jgi:uncharacterized protein YkwD